MTSKLKYLDRYLSFLILCAAMWYCTRPTFAQCPNDLCATAIEIGCEPTEFTNAECALFDMEDNNMNRYVGNCYNSNMNLCGGNDFTSFHTDLWYTFYIPYPGWHDINVVTDYYCELCGASSGNGGVRLFLWKGEVCTNANIVFSKHCMSALCWAGVIGGYTGVEGDAQQSTWYLSLEFLEPGKYYMQIDSWGNGPNHPDFSWSTGSGEISICPTSPLSIDPTLNHTGMRLHWQGHTATDWTVFRMDDTWVEVCRTSGSELVVSQGGYYIVAGSTGFSNIVYIEQVNINQPRRFDVLGREGVKNGIER